MGRNDVPSELFIASFLLPPTTMSRLMDGDGPTQGKIVGDSKLIQPATNVHGPACGPPRPSKVKTSPNSLPVDSFSYAG
jgi:hypothetical protein